MGVEHLLAQVLIAVRFIIVLSVLIVVHEFGHMIAAVRAGVRVEIFSLGFGKRLFSKKHRETEFAVSMIPLGGYIKLAGDTPEERTGKTDEFYSKPVHKRLSIILGGPFMNYVLGIVLFWVVFLVGYPAIGTKVGHVQDGSGAQKAGIIAGDSVRSIEGKDVRLWNDILKAIQDNQDKDVLSITIERDEKILALECLFRGIDKENIFGQKVATKGLGIGPDYNDKRAVRYGIGESFVMSVRKSVELTALTYKSLWLIITGEISARHSVAGPVAMYDIFSRVKSFVELLILMAIVSISLCIFNLLPLPALDGGHVVLLMVEKIRGKYLSKKAEEVFNQIGMSFLIVIGILVLINDLANKGFFSGAYGLFRKIIGAL